MGHCQIYSLSREASQETLYLKNRQHQKLSHVRGRSVTPIAHFRISILEFFLNVESNPAEMSSAIVEC